MIFSSTTPINDDAAFAAACDLFEATYGHEYDGIGIEGFNNYDEAAAANKDMADDALILCDWDSWLFWADEWTTFDGWIAACEDGSFYKSFELMG